MKQPENSSFEKACSEALHKARSINDVPHLIEAVNRASFLIALTPDKVEQIFKEKMQEGTKL